MAGCVLNFRFEDDYLAITMADREGAVAEHRLSAPDDHIAPFNKHLSPRLRLPDEAIEAAGEKLSVALDLVLRSAQEREMTIEIGSYLLLDWTGDHGFVIWPEEPINGISAMPIPWTPIGYSDDVLGQLFSGLDLSPSRREAFEAAVPATEDLKEAAREATDAVIEALIGDPRNRSLFRHARLSPLVGRSGRRELRDWARVPLFLWNRRHARRASGAHRGCPARRKPAATIA